MNEEAANTGQLITVGGQPMSRADAWAAVRRSAHWFWWIAGLSLLNSIAAIFQSKYSMALGLGITQLFDALFYYAEDGTVQSVSTAMHVVHFVLVMVPITLFYFLGRWSANGNRGAWLAGMLLFLLDGGIFLLAADWIGVGIHAFVLFMLWGGLGMLKAVRAAEAAMPPVAEPIAEVEPASAAGA